VTVLPAWGGKIATLFDRRRKRQWLHDNIFLPYQQPQHGADYVGAFDVGGFDDCFPSVAACRYPAPPWQDVSIPDHGDVWSLPWLAEVGVDAITMTVSGIHVPYVLSKTVRLVKNKLHIDYSASNLTPYPMPFVWSSHPLLGLRPGMQIHLPASEMRENGTNRRVAWPIDDGIDLSVAPPPDAGMAMKLFSPPLEKGWVEVVDPHDGAELHFAFDPALVPTVGLWLNYGGWAGVPGVEPYYNVGVEPCIGSADSLVEAVTQGTNGTIGAHETVRWWLSLTMH
jgi:galactose mutarotase-like enzyme